MDVREYRSAMRWVLIAPAMLTTFVMFLVTSFTGRFSPVWAWAIPACFYVPSVWGFAKIRFALRKPVPSRLLAAWELYWKGYSAHDARLSVEEYEQYLEQCEKLVERTALEAPDQVERVRDLCDGHQLEQATSLLDRLKAEKEHAARLRAQRLVTIGQRASKSGCSHLVVPLMAEGQLTEAELVVDHCLRLLNRARPLGLEQQAIDMIAGQSKFDAEAVEVMMTKTLKDRERTRVLTDLQKRVSSLYGDLRLEAIEVMQHLASCDYDNREWRRELHRLERLLEQAEENAQLRT